MAVGQRPDPSQQQPLQAQAASTTAPRPPAPAPNPPYSTPSYIQRASMISYTPPNPNASPPQARSRLGPSLVTDRLNWRRDRDAYEDGGGQESLASTSQSQSQTYLGYGVNPSDFYRQVPGVAGPSSTAAASTSSSSSSAPDAAGPSSSTSASASSSTASSPSAFYSFTVSSNTSALEGLYAAPPSFFQPPPPVPVPPPLPALPPKPPSSPPRAHAQSISQVYYPPPPPPPPIARPPIPPKPPEYLNLNPGPGSLYPAEKAAYFAMASEPSPEQAGESRLEELRLKNEQLLLAHMKSINRARARRDREEFVVRDEDEDEDEHGEEEAESLATEGGETSLEEPVMASGHDRTTWVDLPSVAGNAPASSTAGPAARTAPRRKKTEDVEMEMLLRATELSLHESSSSQHQPDDRTDEDGWERYDPRAFEDAVLSMPLTIPAFAPPTRMGIESSGDGRQSTSVLMTGVNPLEMIPRPVVLPSPPSTPPPPLPPPPPVSVSVPSTELEPLLESAPPLPPPPRTSSPRPGSEDARNDEPITSNVDETATIASSSIPTPPPAFSLNLGGTGHFISPLDEFVNWSPSPNPPSSSMHPTTLPVEPPVTDASSSTAQSSTLVPSSTSLAPPRPPPPVIEPPSSLTPEPNTTAPSRSRFRASTTAVGPRPIIGPRPKTQSHAQASSQHNHPSASRPARSSLIFERSPPARGRIWENPETHGHVQPAQMDNPNPNSRLLRPDSYPYPPRPLRSSVSHGNLSASASVSPLRANYEEEDTPPPPIPPLPRTLSAVSATGSYFTPSPGQRIPPRPPSLASYERMGTPTPTLIQVRSRSRETSSASASSVRSSMDHGHEAEGSTESSTTSEGLEPQTPIIVTDSESEVEFQIEVNGTSDGSLTPAPSPAPYRLDEESIGARLGPASGPSRLAHHSSSHVRVRSLSQAPPLRRSQWDDDIDAADPDETKRTERAGGRPTLPVSSFSDDPLASSSGVGVGSNTSLGLIENTPATAPATPATDVKPSLGTVVSYLVDLMAGVSFGFGPASTVPRTQLPSRARPFPDVITLGTRDAFYIAAPSFRQLLRLLANLGHGTIEHVDPDDPEKRFSFRRRLRPTLQFWQARPQEGMYTVLWLEVDQSSSGTGAPDYARSTSSVSLSPPVPLSSSARSDVKDPADTSSRPTGSVLPPSVVHMPTRGSHLFVCPAPLPSLPRSLPELASYLQSLLAHSRSGSALATPGADSSSPSSSSSNSNTSSASMNGLKRLSKLVDKYYPNDGSGADGVMEPDRKLTGLLSKVMPTKNKAKKGGGGEGSRWRAIRNGGWRAAGAADLNEEAYDLVTPFRLDS